MTLRQIQTVFVLMVSWTLTVINASGQQIRNDGYFINGTIKGIDSGIIHMLSADGNCILDSSLIVKAKFSMQGKIGMPARMLFSITPGNWSFRAFVEDTDIVLRIDTAGAGHYGKGSNTWALIWEIDESGAALAHVYTQFKNETNQNYYVSILSALREKLKAVKDNADASSKVQQKIDSVSTLVFARQKVWIENYISQYPTTIAGVYLFNEYYHSSPDRSLFYLDSVLNRFSGLATYSVYYKELADIAMNLKNTQPNSLAPDFTLLKRNKSRFTLSSTRGKYTLIDFWASWCVPCRKAIPAWKEVYTKYKNKGLLIVGVSSDRRWEDWIKALDKEQMPWVQVLDEFPGNNKPAWVTELFGSKTLPFYVLLDREGKVILASGNKDVIRKKVEQLFE